VSLKKNSSARKIFLQLHHFTKFFQKKKFFKKKKFFQKKKFFSEKKIFFRKKNFFKKKKFFSEKKIFFRKKNFFQKKKFFHEKKIFCEKKIFFGNFRKFPEFWKFSSECEISAKFGRNGRKRQISAPGPKTGFPGFGGSKLCREKGKSPPRAALAILFSVSK